MNESISLCIQVTDLNPNPAFKYSFKAESLLKKFMNEAPLSQEKIQEVLKFIIDASLPVEHAKLFIDVGADVNHAYVGVEKLLHIAWRHAKDDSSNGNEMFTFLLKNGAFLNKKDQNFYKEIDPQFLKFYDKNAAEHNDIPETLQTRPKH